ncbi:hypothetical protein GCM10027080_24870 [Pedococcus soli]
MQGRRAPRNPTWESAGISWAEREQFLSAGLGFDQADAAARWKANGLTPRDLAMSVDGRTAAARIRDGQDVDEVLRGARRESWRAALWTLDWQPSTTITGVDGQPENDVDRIILALEELAQQQVTKPVAVRADDIGVRILLDGNGATLRLAALGAGRAPDMTGFVCTCHPLALVDELAVDVPGSEILVRSVSLGCVPALLGGARLLLQEADDEDSGARVVMDREGLTPALRQSVDSHGVPVRTPTSRPGSFAFPLDLAEMQLRGTAEKVMANSPFSERLPRLGRSRTETEARGGRSAPGGEPRWSGFPVPPLCRRDLKTILNTIDDAVAMATEDVLAAVRQQPCPDHPPGDYAALLTDGTLIEPRADGLLRLTVEGQRRADSLARQTTNFARSTSISRPSTIYAWQDEALQAWVRHGRCGVVEAVTGTGKTRVGIEATAEAVDTGIKVAICVPTLVLMQQWHRMLRIYGIRRVGRVGGGDRDSFKDHDVLIGTVQSLRRVQLLGADTRAMLIVDECHRVGAPTFQDALDGGYERRLGLTATFERSDNRLRDLEAFFEGPPVFGIGYERAVPDGIVAHYVVARVGVDFSYEERADYNDADEACRTHRGNLIRSGVPAEPFGVFMEATAGLARDDYSILGTWAKGYLEAFSRRAEILSMAQGKVLALRQLAPAIASASGALVFTMRVSSAELGAQILQEEGVRAVAIHGQSSDDERESALTSLRNGELDAVVAPRILDEGVDVPEADLGVIVATSSRRLQMIQRMGRVLRLKKGGRRARFVLIYVRDTSEDPTGEGGAHEAFFDAIESTADGIEDFDLDRGDELAHFLTMASQPAPTP